MKIGIELVRMIAQEQDKGGVFLHAKDGIAFVAYLGTTNVAICAGANSIVTTWDEFAKARAEWIRQEAK
ncbi:hypothetical protein [Selenomonas sp. AB3002]|uniref:hypothetical protein n=1 Tax=Selenomonas sp. AB3002 TaxID=1392502 RepID=UPI000495908B